MSVQDWHAYAARVDQRHQQQPGAAAEEPIHDLSTFGLAPADETAAVEPVPPAPVTAPAPAPAPPAPVLTSVVPVEVTPITDLAPVLPQAPGAPAAQLLPVPEELPDVEVALALPDAPARPGDPAAVAAAPLVLAAAEVAPIVIAAAELAPVITLHAPSPRPTAVDADLRPVMADRLAGDLADLTRVLLGVPSSAVGPGPVGFAPPPEVEPLVPPSAPPANEVVPLVPLSVTPLAPHTPHTEEPPTPMAPAPTLSVDVVLSELSFLDG